MRDTIAYQIEDPATAALAEQLAVHLALDRVALDDRAWADAALVVAPSGERRHIDPPTPVVVLTPAAARRESLHGRCVVCGVQDEGDAPTAAVAAALAEALRLALVLVHVVPRVSAAVPAEFVHPGHGLTVEDRASGRVVLDGAASAAGLAGPDDGDRRVLRGSAGHALSAVARMHDAALVAVGASDRPGFVRAVLGSATGYLTRRCDRPVVVCPRNPLPAMQVREALDWTPRHRYDGFRPG